MRILLVINIALLLLLSAFGSTVYDDKFYFDQYQKNGIYEKFEKDEVDRITYELFEFLRSDGELDTDFFNEKELRHMDDVKGLFGLLKILNFVLLVTLLVLLYVTFKSKPDLSKIFFWVGVFISASVLLALALSPFFDNIFLFFHKVAFSNNDWLLDPATDNLIVLFPSEFFISISTEILMTWLLNGMIFFVMALAIRYHKRFLKQKKIRLKTGPALHVRQTK